MALKIRLEIDEKEIRSVIWDSQSDKRKRTSSVVVEDSQNLAKALNASVEKMAKNMRWDVFTFLKNVELIEVATILGTTILETQTGSQVGLIVTKGAESSIFDTEWIPALLGSDQMIGINEEVDSEGRVVKEPKEDEVREAIRSLLDRGAETMVVSLNNAVMNPHNEVFCWEVMCRNFPRYYLGGVPFQKSVEVSNSNNITVRTSLAVVNAYIKSAVSSRLFSLTDELWKMGYRKPLHLININGESVPMGKALALATLDTEKFRLFKDLENRAFTTKGR